MRGMTMWSSLCRESRLGTARVESASKPDRTREAPEAALGQVERGLALVLTASGPLVPGNHNAAVPIRDGDGLRVDARQIHDDFDTRSRFRGRSIGGLSAEVPSRGREVTVDPAGPLLESCDGRREGRR